MPGFFSLGKTPGDTFVPFTDVTVPQFVASGVVQATTSGITIAWSDGGGAAGITDSIGVASGTTFNIVGLPLHQLWVKQTTPGASGKLTFMGSAVGTLQAALYSDSPVWSA